MKDEPPQGKIRLGPGFRVRQCTMPVPPGALENSAGISAAVLADCMNCLYGMDGGIHSVTTLPRSVVGTACTVRLPPGDNLFVHVALEVALPGSVLVIDAAGDLRTAVVGSAVASKAAQRGIVGVVVDGVVRDIDGIREVGIPVFARGTVAQGPFHRGPGEVNYPVQCGGIVVNAGDLVVADASGVTVVPFESVETVLTAAQAFSRRDAAYSEKLRRGEFDTGWVAAQLRLEGLSLDTSARV